MNKYFFTFLFTVFLSPSLLADPKVWTTSEIKKLIGDYPARYSEEEKNDVEVLYHWQKIRTAEDCAAAAAEENASFYAFFGKGHDLLTEAEIKKAAPIMNKASAEMLQALLTAKNYYKRPRPFEYIEAIDPCIEKASGHAYPSGHATSARLYARLLGRMYPERAAAFLQRGDEAAHFRVLGGVHHPSDIEAGKKLGDALAVKVKL